MRYRVIWDPDAFAALRRAWIDAKQPEAGIRAFDALEAALSEGAETKGESREGENRILLVPPLGVIFRAWPETGEVFVLQTWMFTKRSS